MRLNPSHEWRGVLDTILYYVIKFVCELWQVTTKPVHLYDLFSVFKAFDKDNDSHLNEEEWILGMSVFLKGTLDECCKCKYKFVVFSE